MTDEQLRDAYALHVRAAAVATRDAPAADACPSPDDVLALVRGEGPEIRRMYVLDHVAGCARCRPEFDLLRAVERAGVHGERSVVQPLADATTGRVLPFQHARTTQRWLRPLGLAIAASIVVTAGLRWERAHDHDAPLDAERGVADGVALVAPAAGALASNAARGAAVDFVWRSSSQATRYQLEVLAADGRVVFSGTTPDTVLRLPDARRLVPGTTYLWWVRAMDEAGATPRQSALRSLRVRPR